MFRPALAMCLGLVCVVASAAPPIVEPESLKLSGEVGQPIAIRTKTTGKFTEFRPIDKGLYLFPSDLLVDKKATVVSASKVGTYRVLAYSGNADGPGPAVEIVVTIGTPMPGPTPGPTPDPTPDPPPPTPDPSPFTEPGFRVLFVVEKNDLTQYPPGQFNAMEAKTVKDYLNAKCVKGPDGKTAEWRMYDQHTPLTNAPKVWQDVMARSRTSLPWVVVGNGKSGYEGPVPFNKDNSSDLKPIMDLLTKFGGTN